MEDAVTEKKQNTHTSVSSKTISIKTELWSSMVKTKGGCCRCFGDFQSAEGNTVANECILTYIHTSQLQAIQKILHFTFTCSVRRACVTQQRPVCTALQPAAKIRVK